MLISFFFFNSHDRPSTRETPEASSPTTFDEEPGLKQTRQGQIRPNKEMVNNRRIAGFASSILCRDSSTKLTWEAS